MDVNERTLTALGFDEVRAALAGRCRTDVGRDRARARPFLDTKAEVLAAYGLVDEARLLKSEPLSLPIGGLADIRTSVDRASRGGMLEPRELLAVTQALFAFERGHDVLSERAERYPGLAALGQRLPLLGRLATRLDRSIEPSGEISDRASVELKEARDRARALHRRIRTRLDELLRDERFAVNLQESYFSVRNDRYVVPVKSSHQRDVAGIVHNASQTGQTLFVEPTEMIGLGNELAITQSLVLEEERKVLLELSGLVGREASGIIGGIEAAAQLDELEAVASLAADLHAATPTVESADGALVLTGLRHPRLVLKGGEVIANDVELHDARALVVSGPNAGGKTVTLTGVGLCALMARAALPIPAEPGSRMPLFHQVHSAVGDQQDLQQGLSTFSAHVTMLRDIVQRARSGALVLIDEIAADTDPREGAAIATAVLEALLDGGAVVLVTTHLEELKALAHLDPRFVNARVGFDPRRMAPTYRLQLGFAGASSAIDIARRVGLSEAVCARAMDLATNAGGALSKAISATEDERRRLSEQRDAAERDAREAKLARERAERELEAAARARKEEEVRFRSALKAELEYARTQIRTLVESLERDRSDKALKAAQVAAGDLTRRINEQTVAERTARSELKGEARELAPLELRPGARARHRGLDAEVEVLDVQGDVATVAAGALRMRVPVSELGPSGKSAAPPRPPGAAADARVARLDKAEKAAAKPLTLASPTLDVRGERTEDALRLVEQFLDRATRQGEEAALILHGHGTGAIKRELREYLRASPYARSFRAGDGSEGGDAVTVVLLG
jgi:DNA mismatch repair protein MutS2